jgi:hypothetical protein
MDSTRYLARTGISRMKRKPPKDPGRTNVIEFDRGNSGPSLNWMGG